MDSSFLFKEFHRYKLFSCITLNAVGTLRDTNADIRILW